MEELLGNSAMSCNSTVILLTNDMSSVRNMLAPVVLPDRWKFPLHVMELDSAFFLYHFLGTFCTQQMACSPYFLDMDT